MKTALTFIALSAVALIATSCKTTESASSDTADFNVKKFLGEFYAAVMDSMIEVGLSEHEKFDESVRHSFIDFAYEAHPEEEFVDKFSDLYHGFLESVHNSGHFEGKEEERAFASLENVAMPIAMMTISGSIDIYIRMNLEPDFTAPYLQKVGTRRHSLLGYKRKSRLNVTEPM